MRHQEHPYLVQMSPVLERGEHVPDGIGLGDVAPLGERHGQVVQDIDLSRSRHTGDDDQSALFGRVFKTDIKSCSKKR